MSKFLTASDLTSFARNGYLCPLPGLSEGEAAATLAALEEFERRHGGFGKLLRFKAHLRLAALMAVARHERILDAVGAAPQKSVGAQSDRHDFSSRRWAPTSGPELARVSSSISSTAAGSWANRPRNSPSTPALSSVNRPGPALPP